MIDINKKYRMRSGEAVRIYATDGGGLWPVHGAIQCGDYWVSISWKDDGSGSNSDFDLIEINEKEELIKEAKKRYPAGIRFISPLGGLCVSDGNFECRQWEYGGITISTKEMFCYDDGKWAEIVKEHTVKVKFYKQLSSGQIFHQINPDIINDGSATLIGTKTITFYEGEGL